MKLFSLLFATCFLITMSAAAQTVTVESNIAVALKYHVENPMKEKGDIYIRSYKIVTLKTADLIRLIDEQIPESFTAKAKLILQVSYDDEGEIPASSKYVIRDNGTDYNVTSLLKVASNYTYHVRKTSVTTATGLGTSNLLGRAVLTIPLTGTHANVTKGFDLSGTLKASEKYIAITAKDQPTIKPVLSNVSLTLCGNALQIESKSGYVTGTFKSSGAKIVPNP